MSRILIIGPGGIGSAVARHATNYGDSVDLAGRNKPDFEHDHYLPFHTDDEQTMFNIVEHIIEKHVDIVINTIGVLHDEHHTPEKSITMLNDDWFLHCIKVNCLIFLNIIKLLTAKLPSNSHLKFISLSARVGSIEDNHLGGWISYRTSKAALNMAIKTIAIEWHRRFKRASIVGYHPGTVNTKLSEPYQANVKQLLSPEQAGLYLYQFSQTIKPEMSGYIYDWQNERIPY